MIQAQPTAVASPAADRPSKGVGRRRTAQWGLLADADHQGASASSSSNDSAADRRGG